MLLLFASYQGMQKGKRVFPHMGLSFCLVIAFQDTEVYQSYHRAYSIPKSWGMYFGCAQPKPILQPAPFGCYYLKKNASQAGCAAKKSHFTPNWISSSILGVVLSYEDKNFTLGSQGTCMDCLFRGRSWAVGWLCFPLVGCHVRASEFKHEDWFCRVWKFLMYT